MAENTTTPAPTTTSPSVQASKTVVVQPGLKTTTHVLVGDYDTLVADFGSLPVGATIQNTKYTIPGCLATVHIERLNGKQGRASITVTETIPQEVWGLQMKEIQKPIKTWNANHPSDKPDLDKIQLWEALKTTNPPLYAAFKYDTQNQLDGNTKTLAEKIKKGIQYYSLYTPLITCTEHFPQSEINSHLPTLSDVGKINTPAAHPFGNLTHQFLKTSDTLQGALDGTYTRTQSWTGADIWDTDLYPSSTSPS